MLGMATGPVEVLKAGSARVVRQPGDGSCLFHSLAHGLQRVGLNEGASAASLRREIAAFIEKNPNLEISDSPLKDWVRTARACTDHAASSHTHYSREPAHALVARACRRPVSTSKSASCICASSAAPPASFGANDRRARPSPQVLWDSGASVSAYCRKMTTGNVWGGGIEMAALSHLRRVKVLVYQQAPAGARSSTAAGRD
jgi:hypothetical protein